jgi:hypothetical protein
MLGYLVGVLLAAGGAVCIFAYRGTPTGPGPNCGPIDVLGYVFSVDLDCTTMQTFELIAAFSCFVLAVLAVVNARTRGIHSRW